MNTIFINKPFVFSVFFAFLACVAFSPQSTWAEMEMGSDPTMTMMRKKRYRYRQRHHRVQIAVDGVIFHRDNARNKFMDVNARYGYNFGYFELGPSVNVWSPGNGDFQSLYLDFKGWAEFNFIKNTRKQRFVPSLGLETGYLMSQRRMHNLVIVPYFSFKYFVASRTGIVLNVYGEMFTQFTQFFSNRNWGIGVSLAYVHYFH